MTDQKLNRAINKQDKLLKRLPKLIRDIMREELDKSVQKQLKQHIGKFPTKNEFYKMMDELMGELKTIREEQEIIAHKPSDHENRIEKLEDIRPNYQHSPS